jgi:cohesin complex subunit SCC1
LEDLDEQYVQVNLDDDDFSHADDRHQGWSFSSCGLLCVCIGVNIFKLYNIFSAKAVNITLVDNFESGLAETDLFNHFER